MGEQAGEPSALQCSIRRDAERVRLAEEPLQFENPETLWRLLHELGAKAGPPLRCAQDMEVQIRFLAEDDVIGRPKGTRRSR